MLLWDSIVNVQMANNLIKWWKTKFLNGYKQFSVINSESNHLSDTEELLGGNGVSSNGDSGIGLCEAALPTCSTPPLTTPHVSTPTLIQTPQPQVTTDKHLNLEEFSCDVSMEGGIFRDGQERQEFSFTLYDFDGHGKITKDDIAGLVTTIYETLGSSVKVPHYGSKTIKVKLTVSPDQGKRMSATVIDHKSPMTENNQQQEDNGNVKPNVNTTIKDNERHRRQCRRQKPKQETQQQQQHQPPVQPQHTCCNSTTCKNNNNVNIAPPSTAPLIDIASDGEFSDHCSRVSEDEISEDEGECSEDQMPKSCEKIKPKKYQKYISPKHHFSMNTNSAGAYAHVPISPVLCTKARRTKKRSSSMQRKELLEIIQANMEKNNHSFQTPSRKQCPNHVNTEIEHQTEHRKVRVKSKASRDSAAQFQCLANIVNTDTCCLELANMQKRTEFPIVGNNGYQYDKLFGAVVCIPSIKKNENLLQNPLSHSLCTNQKHIRSKSHDLSQAHTFRYHLLEPKNNFTTNTCSYIKHENVTETVSPKGLKKTNCKLKSFETEYEQTPAAFKKNIKKFPQVVLGHSSSPHHLKHRNRQEDQARAMAQVVRWLEQEFSSNVNTNLNKKSEKKTKASAKSTPQQAPETPNVNAASPSISSVERHEHHHVHEHIHHHYHHYQEAPVPVVV